MEIYSVLHPEAEASCSTCFAQGDIETLLTQHRMMAGFNRQYTVKAQAIDTAPHHDVAMKHRDALSRVVTCKPAELKDRR